ncbi:hypothetical protein GCM10011512_14300 [Tersicoccus solisilvae]|uniref:Uncharacterized protein n=1 Tax=Tersicoccus solisilvae TaxID=1882339 RepID=A0ABQ1P1D8_9MICC|nr:hypothetical protein [Tersicoccus solisilvae]GGC88456.1 hypothetical protein GCM10011512_14300 [Tersicoccus solisilvae]
MSAALLEPMEAPVPTVDEACTRCDADIPDGEGFAGLCAACLTDSCADCLAALAGDEGVADGRCHGCVDAAA